MSVTVVIPARLQSTRLPEKVLIDIGGKPMLQHVYEKVAKLKGVDEIVVATDSEKVLSVAKSFGAKARITPESLNSGSERVAFVAREDKEKKLNTKFYINVQGDEPLLDPQAVASSLDLIQGGKFTMTTPAAPLQSVEDFKNPNVVKVLIAESNAAVYFSRFPIPYSRLDSGEITASFSAQSRVFHHLGVYAYTCDTLLRYASLPRTPWELAESLEQLRALYYGIPIGVAQVSRASIGVDTQEDLEKVRALVRNS